MKTISVSDLLGRSVEERLRLVEDLWDTIAEVPEAVPLTDAQREELDRRLAAYHRDPGAGSPWEELRQRIQRHG
jgi:putative addiction module component (TIGR02574 family)